MFMSYIFMFISGAASLTTGSCRASVRIRCSWTKALESTSTADLGERVRRSFVCMVCFVFVRGWCALIVVFAVLLFMTCLACAIASASGSAIAIVIVNAIAGAIAVAIAIVTATPRSLAAIVIAIAIVMASAIAVANDIAIAVAIASAIAIASVSGGGVGAVVADVSPLSSVAFCVGGGGVCILFSFRSGASP